MKKLKALSMLICDEVIEDKKTSKKSLIGLFNQIATTTFPFRHRKLVVFCALTGGLGEYKAVLQYSHLSDLKPIGSIVVDLVFNDPNRILEFDYECVNTLFPQPGKYNFQLLVGGEPLIERVLTVNLNEEKSKSGGQKK